MVQHLRRWSTLRNPNCSNVTSAEYEQNLQPSTGNDVIPIWVEILAIWVKILEIIIQIDKTIHTSKIWYHNVNKQGIRKLCVSISFSMQFYIIPPTMWCSLYLRNFYDVNFCSQTLNSLTNPFWCHWIVSIHSNYSTVGW